MFLILASPKPGGESSDYIPRYGTSAKIVRSEQAGRKKTDQSLEQRLEK